MSERPPVTEIVDRVSTFPLTTSLLLKLFDKTREEQPDASVEALLIPLIRFCVRHTNMVLDKQVSFIYATSLAEVLVRHDRLPIGTEIDATSLHEHAGIAFLSHQGFGEYDIVKPL